MLYSTDIKKLHDTFCMNVYSSELLELSNKYMELINIAYQFISDLINSNSEYICDIIMNMNGAAICQE